MLTELDTRMLVDAPSGIDTTITARDVLNFLEGTNPPSEEKIAANKDIFESARRQYSANCYDTIRVLSILDCTALTIGSTGLNNLRRALRDSDIETTVNILRYMLDQGYLTDFPAAQYALDLAIDKSINKYDVTCSVCSYHAIYLRQLGISKIELAKRKDEKFRSQGQDSVEAFSQDGMQLLHKRFSGSAKGRLALSVLEEIRQIVDKEVAGSAGNNDRYKAEMLAVWYHGGTFSKDNYHEDMPWPRPPEIGRDTPYEMFEYQDLLYRGSVYAWKCQFALFTTKINHLGQDFVNYWAEVSHGVSLVNSHKDNLAKFKSNGGYLTWIPQSSWAPTVARLGNWPLVTTNFLLINKLFRLEEQAQFFLYQNKDNRNALMHAIITDATCAPVVLLAIAKLSPDIQMQIFSQLDADKRNVLMLAAKHRVKVIAPLLNAIRKLNLTLDKQADILAQTDKDGYNALMIASQYQPEAIKPLLTAIEGIEGVDSQNRKANIIGQRNTDGLNVLMLATKHQPKAAAPLLTIIKSGGLNLSPAQQADLIAQTDKGGGYNALMTASQYQPEATIPLLAAIEGIEGVDSQSRKANIIGQCNADGWNALMLAVQYQPKAVELLIAAIGELPSNERAKIIGQVEQGGSNALIIATLFRPHATALSHGSVDSPLLEDRQPDIIEQCDKYGFSEVMPFIMLSRVNTIKLLLSAINERIAHDRQEKIIGQRNDKGHNALMLISSNHYSATDRETASRAKARKSYNDTFERLMDVLLAHQAYKPAALFRKCNSAGYNALMIAAKYYPGYIRSKLQNWQGVLTQGLLIEALAETLNLTVENAQSHGHEVYISQTMLDIIKTLNAGIIALTPVNALAKAIIVKPKIVKPLLQLICNNEIIFSQKFMTDALNLINQGGIAITEDESHEYHISVLQNIKKLCVAPGIKKVNIINQLIFFFNELGDTIILSTDHAKYNFLKVLKSLIKHMNDPNGFSAIALLIEMKSYGRLITPDNFKKVIKLDPLFCHEVFLAYQQCALHNSQKLYGSSIDMSQDKFDLLLENPYGSKIALFLFIFSELKLSLEDKESFKPLIEFLLFSWEMVIEAGTARHKEGEGALYATLDETIINEAAKDAFELASFYKRCFIIKIIIELFNNKAFSFSVLNSLLLAEEAELAELVIFFELDPEKMFLQLGSNLDITKLNFKPSLAAIAFKYFLATMYNAITEEEKVKAALKNPNDLIKIARERYEALSKKYYAKDLDAIEGQIKARLLNVK